MKFIAKNEKETSCLAKSLAKCLSADDLLTLSGDLGAGKTFFVRELAEGLGIDPLDVSSPSFTIMQVYESSVRGTKLCHFDAYRLDNPKAFLEEGFSEYLNADMIVCIEWAERVEESLPEDRLDINIDSNRHTEIDFSAESINIEEDRAERFISFEAKGERAEEILHKWQESADFPGYLLSEN